MLVVSSDVHRQHHGVEISQGRLIPCTEGPDRADLIKEALVDVGHDLVSPDPVDTALLASVHLESYVSFLESAWDRWQERGNGKSTAMGFTWPARGLTSTGRPDDLIGQLGYHSFSADTTIGPATWAAASTAAGMAQTAADRTADRGETTFALCRPPGHHATADQFGGYCYLNNAAVAAQRLLDRGAKRVAVLDVDYHHGNGTQTIFYQRSDVLFVSLHADPAFEFPWFLGRETETGTGDGAGWNLNLPLARGTELRQFLDALAVGLDQIGEADVDGLVVSLGVDTYVEDPLGTFDIKTTDFTAVAAAIAAIGLPTVIVQEGGYAVGDIGSNVAAFLEPWA